MRTTLIAVFLCTTLFCFSQDSSGVSPKLQKYYYRSELVTGPLVMVGSAVSLSYALTFQKNIGTGFGISGLAGIVLGSIVLGFGIDDRKEFKQQHKIQAVSSPNSIGFALVF